MLKNSLPVGKFHLDLGALFEECSCEVVSDVKEKNLDFLDGEGNLLSVRNVCSEVVKEDGFPDILDLSSYFSEDERKRKLSKKGLSIFATEFDANAGERYDSEAPSINEKVEDCIGDINEENEKKLKSLSADELRKAKQEIYERFDEKTLNFLKARGQKKALDKSSGKVSEFKKLRQNLPNVVDKDNLNDSNVDVGEKIKGLEVFSVDDKLDDLRACGATGAHTRLATDAVHLDFMTKCFKSLIPRKQQSIIRLFEGFHHSDSDDDLIKMAISNIPAIKGLFLDEQQTYNSKSPTYLFTNGMNPLEQSCWPLCPIRKVLDVCEKDGKVAAEDVVVVRLSLLWSVLLLVKRPSLFRAFTSVQDTYIRLAEVFLISKFSYICYEDTGPDVFTDQCVKQCVNQIIKKYIIPTSLKGLFSIRLTDPVGGLDAFCPFYEDFLKHYEEDGMGDELFSRLLLIGAYMNSSLKDSLLMQCALWTPQRQLCRVIIIESEDDDPILVHLKASRNDDVELLESEFYVQYSQLLAIYAKSIREELVTRQRNPLMFKIASTELGFFINRHEQRIKTLNDGHRERLKEFDLLVDMFRHALAGKLEL
uniref:RPAP1_N domain-containing protein n=1 Tax=Syphacia muris TaxID=451379 RepID=A0A0N5AKL2_9BILA